MKRNKFSLSHSRLFTCDMGELVPCGVLEVLPGDSFQMATSLLLRCSPLMAPVMHPVDVRIHHWFVPNRIVWDDWEDFITGGPTNTFTGDVPWMFYEPAPAIGSLADYLGVPSGDYSVTPGGLYATALAFRAYAMIWNEFYRDQDLQAEIPMSTGLTSLEDTVTNRTLQHCGWEKDYFTSARPWVTKGPSVTLPLGTSAPVTFFNQGDAVNAVNLERASGSAGATVTVKEAGTPGFPTPPEDIVAFTNLASASSVTINTLRASLALQRFQEARARYGSRYTEYLRYLGVRSSDARLQRPEYLGGGRQTIQFSEVLQTADTEIDTEFNPTGQLRGHGISALRSNRFRRFFEEHGYILSLLSVRPKTIYLDTKPRHFAKYNREDFWQKEFEHMGQQGILNEEVHPELNNQPNVPPWGYQDRYDEYRRAESFVSGEFRSLLSHWHFGRGFGTPPALNADFIKCVPPETPFAVQSQDTLWIQARHSVQARRLVSQTGTSFTF